MAKFSRLEVYQKMAAYPVVPLLYHNDTEACKHILQACYNGGIRVFEFTNRGEFAHEIFAELVKYARQNCPDLAMGVGTMLDAGTVSLYLQLGADFVVTPNLVEEIAKVCNRRKIPWIPGVATMTEITKAEELGAEVIKIFPGQVMGPGFVKALKGPLPWTSVMATGGVEPTVESLTKWFEAGVTCVGLGSQLFPKKVLEGGDYASLEAQIREVMSIVATLRKK